MTEDASAVQARINTLLAQGKNVYQPLYNYPYEQNIPPLRGCEDRCEVVWAAMGADTAGCKLWDVGCSLGYNTLYFVDRGLVGHGTDIDPRNIAICREISRYTRGTASFAQRELTLEAVEALAVSEHDYAFFFSVLHHIIEAHGLPYVQSLMKALLEKIPVLFVELALRGETPPPGYGWDAHLPDDELSIFATSDAPVIKLIGEFPTHVCPVSRPLYRISRKSAG